MRDLRKWTKRVQVCEVEGKKCIRNDIVATTVMVRRKERKRRAHVNLAW